MLMHKISFSWVRKLKKETKISRDDLDDTDKSNARLGKAGLK